MALIFTISSMVVDVPQVQRMPFRDKGIHFVEYAVLGLFCAAAAERSRPRWFGVRPYAFAFLVAALWGVSDEIHQAFVPGRSAELADVVADALGALAGVIAWRLFSNRTVS